MIKRTTTTAKKGADGFKVEVQYFPKRRLLPYLGKDFDRSPVRDLSPRINWFWVIVCGSDQQSARLQHPMHLAQTGLQRNAMLDHAHAGDGIEVALCKRGARHVTRYFQAARWLYKAVCANLSLCRTFPTCNRQGSSLQKSARLKPSTIAASARRAVRGSKTAAASSSAEPAASF